MAKSTYTCPSCSDLVDVIGRNRKDADSRAAYYEKRGDICSACERKKWAAENKAAAERATTSGLPQLTGSDKQVVWAAKIREGLLAKLDGIRAATLADLLISLRADYGLTAEQVATCTAEVTDALALIMIETRDATEAKWWIDAGRSYNADAMLRELKDRLADLCPVTKQLCTEAR